MSSNVRKYLIRYDGNDGITYTEYIYCKFERVCDCQKWYNEDGTPVDFGSVTDSHAFVKACCIASIPTNDEYFYWEEINDFDIPEVIAKAFNYVYPQRIKQRT